MGNFKESSSSSGFVSVITTLLILLAVIINIYPATAAASLEAVEEVAKDQETTEVAGVHHHEIRERVLLLGALKPLIGGIGRVAKGAVTHAKPRFTAPSQGLKPRFPRKSLDFMLDQYQYLDQICRTLLYCYIYPSAVGDSCQCGKNYMDGYKPCTPYCYIYPSAVGDSCQCGTNYMDGYKPCTPYCYIYPSAVGDSCKCGTNYMDGYKPCLTEDRHCCKGKNGYCATCCKGEATYGTPRPDIFP